MLTSFFSETFTSFRHVDSKLHLTTPNEALHITQDRYLKMVNLYSICKEASFSFQLINCELFNEQILSTAPWVLLLLFANKLRTRVLWFPSNKGNLCRPWMVNRNFTFRAGIEKQKRCHSLASPKLPLPPINFPDCHPDWSLLFCKSSSIVRLLVW